MHIIQIRYLLHKFFTLIIVVSGLIQYVKSSKGVFEVDLVSYTLRPNFNASACCNRPSDSPKSASSQSIDTRNNAAPCTPNSCNVFLHICLSVYQRTPYRKECDIGDGPIVTPVIGHAVFNHTITKFQILVNERWKTSFTLLMELRHEISPTEFVTLATISSAEEASPIPAPNSRWSNRLWREPAPPDDTLILDLRYRFRCAENYYGEECDTLCKASDNAMGHYECTSRGERKCYPGWQGNYCEKPICLEGCEHGSCEVPGQCICPYGWNGTRCDSCIVYPGCKHGKCKMLAGKQIPLTCECDRGWAGMFCNFDREFCTHNQSTCKNGGQCVNEADGDRQYQCKCRDGYRGTHCERREDNCVQHGCGQHGTCQNNLQCRCYEGFYGAQCQFNQTQCSENPCQAPGSVCLSGQKPISERENSTVVVHRQPLPAQLNFRCQCSSGFTGVNCEIDIDDCASSPCHNGGKCVDQTNGYTCICPVGYSGTTCQVNDNDCYALSCAHEGRCLDGPNRVECKCQPGYTGEICEIDVDECASASPCRNQGICTNRIGTYHCRCPSGFLGKNCELSNVTSTEVNTVGQRNRYGSILNLVLITLLGVFMPMVVILLSILVFIMIKRRRNSSASRPSNGSSCDFYKFGSIQNNKNNANTTINNNISTNKRSANFYTSSQDDHVNSGLLRPTAKINNNVNLSNCSLISPCSNSMDMKSLSITSLAYKKTHSSELVFNKSSDNYHFDKLDNENTDGSEFKSQRKGSSVLPNTSSTLEPQSGKKHHHKRASEMSIHTSPSFQMPVQRQVMNGARNCGYPDTFSQSYVSTHASSDHLGPYPYYYDQPNHHPREPMWKPSAVHRSRESVRGYTSRSPSGYLIHHPYYTDGSAEMIQAHGLGTYRRPTNRSHSSDMNLPTTLSLARLTGAGSPQSPPAYYFSPPPVSMTTSVTDNPHGNSTPTNHSRTQLIYSPSIHFPHQPHE